MKLFIASKLSDKDQRDLNKEIFDICKSLKIKTYLPQIEVPINTKATSREILEFNENAVDCSDTVLILFDKCGTGSAMELERAQVLKKKIIGFRSENSQKKEYLGKMLEGSWERIPKDLKTNSFYELKNIFIDILKKEEYSKLKEFYNSVANEYSNEKHHPTTNILKKIEEFNTKDILKNKSFDTVIDIGCGDGNFLTYVNAKNKIGIDLSINMINRHYSKLPEANYLIGNFSETILKTSCADLVHCSFLLDHIMDVDEFLSEVNRIMKKDAIFILSLYSPEKIIKTRKGDFFEYRTANKEKYLVMSNFRKLINLKEKLKKYFKIKKFNKINSNLSKHYIDYYILKK